MSFFHKVHVHTLDTLDSIGEENRLMRGAYYIVGFSLWMLILPTMSVNEYFGYGEGVA